MNAEELKTAQAPLKDRYRNEPESALLTMRAQGKLDASAVICNVQTHVGTANAGLHPAAGGDESFACSGEMLLEALVGCAGVTLAAVATALKLPLRGGIISAEGDLDFRGTLGVSKEVPIGFQRVQLQFDLETDADDEQIETLIKLTERYCVVYQTLKNVPRISTSVSKS